MSWTASHLLAAASDIYIIMPLYPQFHSPYAGKSFTNCGTYNFQVKHVHVPCATVGPDEPHAASTTWPDGVVDGQDLDSFYHEPIKAEIEAFLNSELPSHPKLFRGQLKNGLRYLILPNKVPASRYSLP